MKQEHRQDAPPDLTSQKTLAALLRKHGLYTKKGLGQHLLIDRDALDAISAATGLGEPDAPENALEVGAGTGVLTVELARGARRVVAVELDHGMVGLLHETTGSFANVEIIEGDLLKVDPAAVFGAEPYILAANLPYYITAAALRHFLEAAHRPVRMVVMAQREVAERLVAAPGDMSLLSVSVQFYGHPTLIRRVPASAFFPAPQVDSAVVRVDLSPTPPLEGEECERMFTLARAGFAEKRKQLHNSLARNLRYPAETISRWLTTAQIDPMRRAQTLSIDDWIRLTRASLDAE